MYIKARTINGAWRRILSAVWQRGSRLRSQRGETRELYGLLVRVEEPFDKVIDGFPMGPKELDAYAKQLMNPDKAGFDYTYGERLNAWGLDLLDKPVDQVREVVRKLRKNRSTRRAVAVTWIPLLDVVNTEVPCLIMADFKVRDGRLHLACSFRSNDMYGAWPANAYGLSRLNQFVAKKVRAKPGPLATFSVSAHVYGHDYGNVEKLLGLG